MKNMNICLMNDSFPPAIDGVANAVTNYAQIISREYGRTAVVTPYYPDADDSRFAFPVLRYPSLDMTKQLGYRAGMPFSPELMHQLETSGFDIIHSHCPISSTLLARALRDRIDVPLVLTYHTKFDIDIANAVRSKLLREEAARLLVENISACDEVWTVSRGAGDNLRKLGYEGEYTVMPNGVDLPQGRVPESTVEKVTEGFDLPAGLPVFLFVGRMMWYKGIRLILDALKMLSDKGLDFRMVFVGAGNDRDEIMEYTASLGLDGKVLFSPPVRDRELIRAWYCRADLFLFPSTFDTNGLVVREAAACALASVLVSGSCAAEDVSDGENGFLIEENAESMAALLCRLLGNRPEIRRVGERAQKELYMSWETAVSRAFDRYGAVMDNYRRGLYPRHDKLTDELVHRAAVAMNMFNRNRERQQQFISEMQSGYEEFKTDIKDERGRLKEKVETLLQYMDRFM